MIDLNSLELPGIKTQHFAVRELFWIKTPFPLLIGVSGSACKKVSFTRNRKPPRPWHLNTAGTPGKGQGAAFWKEKTVSLSRLKFYVLACCSGWAIHSLSQRRSAFGRPRRQRFNKTPQNRVTALSLFPMQTIEFNL